MTSNSTTQPFRPSAAGPLSPELLDGVTDALMSGAGAAYRSAVICRLVHEMYHSVAWLHDGIDDHDELASLLRVVEEAESHRIRQAGQGGLRLTSSL